MSARLLSSMCAAISVSAIMACASVSAAEPTPVELQKARHDHYHELGDATKVVRDQTRASSPDFAALQKAAEAINEASINQGRWFPKGTGPEAGKTRALPEIWSKPADFEAAQKQFSDSAPKLLAAVKTNNIENVNNAFRDVGASCKNCHDNFRQPGDH